MPDPHDISQRKTDHLALCRQGDVGFVAKTALWEEVDLVHEALPELAVHEIDLSVELLGKRLRAPLLIAAMTGGTEEAAGVNRALAAAAERHGIGFCFGSQRPMLRGNDHGYLVRNVAPTTLVVGNLGVVQAAALSTAELRALADRVGADAMAIHLNAAQEMAQPAGDRDFRGGMEAIRRIVAELGLEVLVKETGAGIGGRTAGRLAAAGVRWIDVGGAGGTSWVAVEMHRAEAGERAVAERFRDWGTPTAAALLHARSVDAALIATGGVANGLDAAKAIALGARAVGVARPLLQALARGEDALDRAITTFVAELRTAMVLTGSRDLDALRRSPVVIGPRLQAWAGVTRQ